MGDDCDRVVHELETYLDGECATDLEAVVRRHLEDCPPCLDRVHFERELRVIVATKCRDLAPPGLADRITTFLLGH